MIGASFNSNSSILKPATTSTIKFLCSYGGKILPRYPDRKLRYQGGETRILAVDRSISFSELLLKLGELCGTSVSLRCQLPTEDLDALVSITSDEDLENLLEEYDRAASPTSYLKIRAFLSLPKSPKTSSPRSSPAMASPSSSSSSSPKGCCCATVASSPRIWRPVIDCCYRQISPPVTPPFYWEKSSPKAPQCAYSARQNSGHIFLIRNSDLWL